MRGGYEPMDVRDGAADEENTQSRRARRRTPSKIQRPAPVGLKGGASEGTLALVKELQRMFEEPLEELMVEVLDEYGRDDDGAGRGLHKLNAYWSPMVRFVRRNHIHTILFIPYAKKDMDSYAERYKAKMGRLGVKVQSIHEMHDPVSAVEHASAIAIGGGNTFLLLKRLYDAGIVRKIRERVLKGVPYIGSSAGTNVAAINICTTNDMPIIQPKRLEAIGLLPFNVNVHFECGGTCSEIQRRETRIDRLRDYLELYDSSPPIVCIRDSSALYVEGHVMAYVGTAPGKLFTRGHEEPTTIPVGTDLSFLLEGRTSAVTKMCLT